MPFPGFLVSNGKFEPVSVVLAGTIGNLVGSILTYFLGINVGRAFILKYGKYILFKKIILNLQKNCSRNMETKFHSFADFFPQSEHIFLYHAALVKLILFNFRFTHS